MHNPLCLPFITQQTDTESKASAQIITCHKFLKRNQRELSFISKQFTRFTVNTRLKFRVNYSSNFVLLNSTIRLLQCKARLEGSFSGTQNEQVIIEKDLLVLFHEFLFVVEQFRKLQWRQVH